MAIIGFPFDNVEYDASALGAWLCTRTRGVFSAEEHYTVTIDGDLSVSVSPGIAWLKMAEQWGVVAQNPAPVSLPVAVGDGILNRMDAVCLRVNKNTSAIELVIKQGYLAATPVIPDIERDLDYDEIYLATISLPAGTTELTPAMITDQRMNPEYCGLMRDGVTGIPTAQIQAQAEALMALLRNEISNINAGSEMMLKTAYAPDATAEMADGVLTVTSVYTHPETSYAVEFDMPDGYEPSSSLVLDGANVTVTGADGEELELDVVPGVPVFLARRGDLVFPKMGGSSANYDVVGGATQPEGKENRFWVNTSVPISNYFMIDKYGTPNGLIQEGTVCITLGGTRLPFSPFKGNKGLNAMPNYIEQRVGSTWIKPKTMLYQSGEWKSLFDGTVFNNGTESISTSMGVVANTSGYTAASVTNLGTVIRMIVSGAGNTTASAVAYWGTELVDCTAYSSLKMNIISGSALTSYSGTSLALISTLPPLQVSPTYVTPVLNGAVAQEIFFQGGTGEKSLNISAISGKYYPVFIFYSRNNGTTYADISKAWLE